MTARFSGPLPHPNGSGGSVFSRRPGSDYSDGKAGVCPPIWGLRSLLSRCRALGAVARPRQVARTAAPPWSWCRIAVATTKLKKLPAPRPASEVSFSQRREDDKMKPIVISMALVAAVAIAAPAGAQQAPSNPSVPAPHPVQPLGRMPAGGPPTSERGITGSVERAHHRPHRVSHPHASQPVTTSPGTTKPTN